MKHLFEITLSFALLQLISCVTPKVNIIEINQNELCSDLNNIDSIVLHDMAFLNHFSLNQNNKINYLKPAYIYIGFPRSLLSEFAAIRYQSDSTKSDNQAYSDATKDYLMYLSENKLFRNSCKNDTITRFNADFEINYWYSSIDSLFSTEIVRILKTPGHTQGYLFITKKINNNFCIIRRNYWTE